MLHMSNMGGDAKTGGMNTLSGYISIKQSSIPNGKVISLYPKGWLAKAARAVSISSNPQSDPISASGAYRTEDELKFEMVPFKDIGRKSEPMITSRSIGSKIRELVYLPSCIELYPWIVHRSNSTYKIDESVVDDDHLCSLLCDQGFIVHTLEIVPGKEHIKEIYFKAIRDLITNICVSKTPRNIAIISQEISTLRILSFLSEVCN